jgi:hypothetical protein
MTQPVIGNYFALHSMCSRAMLIDRFLGGSLSYWYDTLVFVPALRVIDHSYHLQHHRYFNQHPDHGRKRCA